jgi:hypothetical protein
MDCLSSCEERVPNWFYDVVKYVDAHCSEKADENSVDVSAAEWGALSGGGNEWRGHCTSAEINPKPPAEIWIDRVTEDFVDLLLARRQELSGF